MKNTLFLLIVLSLFGCNRHHSSHIEKTTPDDLTIEGLTKTNTDTINVVVDQRQLIVSVLRPNETEWDQLNKYEYGADPVGTVIFKYKVEILPGGQLRFHIPREYVAPVGTLYQIRSISMKTEGI